MLFRELITEANNLTKAELLKVRDVNRLEVFLQKIAAGSESPFTTTDGQRFDADPSQLEQIKQQLEDPEYKGQITVRNTQGQTIPIGKLAKTKEFGGQQLAWDADPEAGGKESFVVKPSDLWPGEGGNFTATQLFPTVINNKTLNSSEIGKTIVNIAKQIQAGQPADWATVDKKFQPAIRDYAGEYLGVLALINGTANFPNRDAFVKHLGAGLDKINYFFPAKPNFPLGDSLGGVDIDGAFTNMDSGNVIYISSKGGKKGAPPSLNNLKIPENLRTQEYAREIEFIETLQNPDTSAGPASYTQSLIGINKLFELAPDSIPQNIARGLPFSADDIARIVDMQRNRKDVDLKNISELPETAQKMLEGIDFSKYREGVKPSGVVMYLCAKTIVNAVNKTDAMPNFPPLAREILQHNFIQIFARPKGGVLSFDVLWPNREMGTGKVELYYKGSANEPNKQRLSFSVS